MSLLVRQNDLSKTVKEQRMSFTLPDEVEDATNVDLEGVPPRIRIFLIQRLNTKRNGLSKSQQAAGKRGKGGEVTNSLDVNAVIAPALAMSISSFPKRCNTLRKASRALSTSRTSAAITSTSALCAPAVAEAQLNVTSAC
jgi:hypothetical protein